MNCRRARPLLALGAGGDLPPRKADRLESHLSRCPDCRSEIGSYRSALEEIKGMARHEVRPEWSEEEWRALMRRLPARPGGGKRARPIGLSLPVRSWAASAAIVLAASALVLVLMRKPPSPAAPDTVRTESRLPEAAERAAAQPGPAVPGSELRPASPLQPRPQAAARIRECVFVSSESGLTIHWTLNSDFEWKEKVR